MDKAPQSLKIAQYSAANCICPYLLFWCQKSNMRLNNMTQCWWNMNHNPVCCLFPHLQCFQKHIPVFYLAVIWCYLSPAGCLTVFITDSSPNQFLWIQCGHSGVLSTTGLIICFFIWWCGTSLKNVCVFLLLDSPELRKGFFIIFKNGHKPWILHSVPGYNLSADFLYGARAQNVVEYTSRFYETGMKSNQSQPQL